eukprot:CAMPEP_0181028232 /NCGR_PEP_ID=MMETSP1070-20121207/4565_1 /TAXON_ID=265543 /ORGANISM="Minutocellus polymorphus, Strain NH13" /LENGTH=129 /DNA_ID=CAMNT_0023105481 /DNA_START=323 /DNA_END=712 /DNA_ORIENTATION=-
MLGLDSAQQPAGSDRSQPDSIRRLGTTTCWLRPLTTGFDSPTRPAPSLVKLPGLELDQTLGPDLVQDAEAALPTPDGVGALDDVAGAAISAAVLDASEGGDGDGGGSGGGGGGGWFGHRCILFIENVRA